MKIHCSTKLLMRASLLSLMWMLCMSVHAQKTTMVVDCQTPGWLSSKIDFEDQKTLTNLTVTGYLNGSDIKFLRELFTNRKLTHIDISDCNIVSGGSAYYENYITKDNYIGSFFFGLIKVWTICLYQNLLQVFQKMHLFPLMLIHA